MPIEVTCEWVREVSGFASSSGHEERGTHPRLHLDVRPSLGASGAVRAAVSVVGRTRSMTGTRGNFLQRSLIVSARRISAELAASRED